MASVIAPPSHAALCPAAVERRKPCASSSTAARTSSSPTRPWTSIREIGASSASAPRPRAIAPSPLRHPAVSRGVGPGPPGLSSSSLRGCIDAVIVSPVFRRRFCDAPSRFVEFKLNA